MEFLRDAAPTNERRPPSVEPVTAPATQQNSRKNMPPRSQGAVSSVREFAAAHAASEEFARSSRQMNELLRIDKLEEAQRRMAELSRDKVHRAVVQTRGRDGSEIIGAPSATPEAEMNDADNIRDMAAEVCCLPASNNWHTVQPTNWSPPN